VYNDSYNKVNKEKRNQTFGGKNHEKQTAIIDVFSDSDMFKQSMLRD
jgi:hypothetical protein